MVLTKIPGPLIVDDAITSAKITDTTITNAKMAVDPSNASNLSSGDVPLAQLGNVPDPDLTAQKGDIALLAFKTQANGNLARYNLVDQSVDAFEDATGISAGDSTYAERDSTGKYYSGKNAASGGTVTTHGSYTVHSFITAGNENFVVGAAGNVALLVVAGGGGGGLFSGGGGGAGGFRTSASHAVTAQTYVVTVGAGGAGGTNSAPGDPAGWYRQGYNGGNSVFDTITSAGGGGGMGYGDPGSSNDLGGTAGGSGGGGGTTTSTPATLDAGAGNTPSTSPSQGYAGGDGTERNYSGAPSQWYGGGGGGGGAGAVGVASGSNPDKNDGGAGGIGATNDYRTGASVTYAGGGGAAGGKHFPNTPATFGDNGAGGAGGGGTGAAWTAPMDGQYNSANNGTANTGGGGGGAPGSNWGGYGGSGIVVVRYTTGDLASDENMILESITTTTATAPTKGDLVFTYTNGAGTTVVGTNVTAEYSADAGSTWTDFGIAAGDVQGTTGGHTIVTKNNVALTSTSGTNMRYRIKTLVQSASLVTRIHAVSLGWS